MSEDITLLRSDFAHATCAHAAYFSAFTARVCAQTMGDGTAYGQLRALRSLKTELQNIYMALDIALSREALDWLLPIAENLFTFFDYTGGSLQSQQVYTALFDVAARSGHADLELAALLGLSRAQYRLGDPSDSRANAGHAHRIACELNDRRGQSSSLSVLGLLNTEQGAYVSAQGQFEEAGAIRRELGDALGESHALSSLGHIANMQGDYVAARTDFEQSMKLQRQVGNRLGEASSLNNLAIVNCMSGDYSSAREQFEKAVAITREFGDLRGESNTLGNLGLIHFNDGDYAAARELYAQALAIQHDLGDRRGASYSLHNLGSVHLALGDYAAARSMYGQALEIRRELGDRHQEAVSLQGLGTVDCLLGEFVGASMLYLQALTTRRELEDKAGIYCSGVCAAAALLGMRVFANASISLHGWLLKPAPPGPGLASSEQQAVDSAILGLDVALASGQFSAADLHQWQAEGEAMSFDELVEFTLGALREAQGTLNLKDGDRAAAQIRE